jgi:hypothetical protein
LDRGGGRRGSAVARTCIRRHPERRYSGSGSGLDGRPSDRAFDERGAGYDVGPPEPAPDGPKVRRTTGSRVITLNDGRGVDFDNLASPNWGVTSALPSGPKILRQQGSPETDIGWQDGELIFIGDSAVESTVDGYDTCASETGYGPDDWKDLVSGTKFCMVTNEKRYAIVEIKNNPVRQIKFTVTVYDPPVEN